MDTLVSRGNISRTEVHVPTPKRQLSCTFEGFCVVVIDAMEPHLIEALKFLNIARKGGDISGTDWGFLCAEFAANESAIEQHRVGHGHCGPPTKRPQSGWGTNPSYMTPTEQPFLRHEVYLYPIGCARDISRVLGVESAADPFHAGLRRGEIGNHDHIEVGAELRELPVLLQQLLGGTQDAAATSSEAAPSFRRSIRGCICRSTTAVSVMRTSALAPGWT